MKVTGSNITITDSVVNKMQILPLGNCEQVNYNGNNKFDGIYELGTINGNGVPINSSVIIRTKNFTNILPNEQYTITVPNEVIGVECFYYNNNVFIATFQPNLNEDKTATITTLNNVNQIKWRFNTGYTTIENKTMFNIGDTAQPFEPYVGGIPSPNPSYPQEVKVVTGDNQVVVQNKNLVYEKLEGKFLASNGIFSTDERYDMCFARVVQGVTYTVKSDEGQLVCGFYYNKPSLSSVTYNNSRTVQADNLTITAPITGYIGFRTLTGYSEAQCEVGSTSTSYVPHQEQSTTLHLGSLELCKIGDYQDVITGSKDNWKVVRKVGKYVFNKADITAFATNLTNTNMVQIRNTTYLNNTLHRDNSEVLCNISKGKNVFSLDEVGTFTFYNAPHNFGGIYMRFLKTDFSTQEELETYIDNNTINYYFPLYTPIEETITDTTLINELNGLQDMLSYDGTTNITITSDSNNAQMIVEVTYTSESDMNEKLTNIFNSIKSKLYHIIRAL